MIESDILSTNSDAEIISKLITEKYIKVLSRKIIRNTPKREEDIYSKLNNQSYLIFPIKDIDKDTLDKVVK